MKLRRSFDALTYRRLVPDTSRPPSVPLGSGLQSDRLGSRAQFGHHGGVSAPAVEPGPQGPPEQLPDRREATEPPVVAARGLALSGAVLLALFGWLAGAVFGESGLLALDRIIDPVAVRLAGWLMAGQLDRLDGRWLLAPALVAWAGLVWWGDQRSDRRLSSCLVVGPLAALVAGQLLARPVIGRRFDAVFTFPSGATTVVAALLTAVVVGRGWPRPAQRRSRRRQAAAGAAVAAVASAMAVAVVSAGHATATDALAGALLGAATMLLTAATCARFLPADRLAISRTWLRYGLCVVAGAALCLVGAVPLPYYVLSPGSLIGLNSAILVREPGVAGAEALNGTYSGLTVRSVTLTLGGWAWHEISGSINEIVPREAIVPAGRDDAEHRAMERQRFVDASAVAVAVAEQKLGKAVRQLGDGALVTAIEPGTAADGVLVVGDVVIALGGIEVTTDAALREALIAVTSAAGRDPAPSTTFDEQSVPTELTVRAFDGTVRTVAVQLRRLSGSGRFGLGIGVATANLHFELPVEVAVDGGRVGGPSAGLLTALAVYDTLSDEDLAAGRHIAGTGTLSLAGTVGRIGAIEEKVRAAVAFEAEVFLVPAEQADEAVAAAQGRIKVIGVHSFDDGLTALRQR